MRIVRAPLFLILLISGICFAAIAFNAKPTTEVSAQEQQSPQKKSKVKYNFSLAIFSFF
jgi:hypothetical protein